MMHKIVDIVWYWISIDFVANYMKDVKKLKTAILQVHNAMPVITTIKNKK